MRAVGWIAVCEIGLVGAVGHEHEHIERGVGALEGADVGEVRVHHARPDVRRRGLFAQTAQKHILEAVVGEARLVGLHRRAGRYETVRLEGGVSGADIVRSRVAEVVVDHARLRPTGSVRALVAEREAIVEAVPHRLRGRREVLVNPLVVADG